MPLFIKDDETAALVAELAKRWETSKQGAVKRVVEAELHRLDEHFDEKLRQVYERFPRPEPTGLEADKAFFDELSGEFD